MMNPHLQMQMIPSLPLQMPKNGRPKNSRDTSNRILAEQQTYISLTKQLNLIDQFIQENEYFGDQLQDDDAKSDSVQLNQDQYEHYNEDLREEMTKQISEYFCILNHQRNIELYIQAYKFEKTLNFLQISNMNPKFIKQIKQDIANKLIQLRKVAETFIMKGNLMNSVRSAFRNKFINPGLYLKAVKYVINIMVRLLEKFIEQRCHKAIKPVREIKHQLQIQKEVVDYRNFFEVEQIETMRKIIKAIFKIEKINYISNNEIFRFYKALRRVETRSFNFGNNQALSFIKHYRYEKPRFDRQEPLNYQDFIQKRKQRQVAQQLAYDAMNPNPNQMDWSELMDRRIIKGIFLCKNISQLKSNLQRIYIMRNRRFQIPQLQQKVRKVCKKAIQFTQQDFYRYCKYRNIRTINFSQMKFITLNNFQIQIFIINQQGLQARRLLLDYYQNNCLPPLIQREDYTDYRVTYLKYIIQSTRQFLQTKKMVKYVMTDKEQEKYKLYYLDQVNQRSDSIIKQANTQFTEMRKNLRKFHKEINKASSIEALVGAGMGEGEDGEFGNGDMEVLSRLESQISDNDDKIMSSNNINAGNGVKINGEKINGQERNNLNDDQKPKSNNYVKVEQIEQHRRQQFLNNNNPDPKIKQQFTAITDNNESNNKNLNTTPTATAASDKKQQQCEQIVVQQLGREQMLIEQVAHQQSRQELTYEKEWRRLVKKEYKFDDIGVVIEDQGAGDSGKLTECKAVVMTKGKREKSSASGDSKHESLTKRNQYGIISNSYQDNRKAAAPRRSNDELLIKAMQHQAELDIQRDLGKDKWRQAKDTIKSSKGIKMLAQDQFKKGNIKLKEQNIKSSQKQKHQKHQKKQDNCFVINKEQQYASDSSYQILNDSIGDDYVEEANDTSGYESQVIIQPSSESSLCVSVKGCDGRQQECYQSGDRDSDKLNRQSQQGYQERKKLKEKIKEKKSSNVDEVASDNNFEFGELQNSDLESQASKDDNQNPQSQNPKVQMNFDEDSDDENQLLLGIEQINKGQRLQDWRQLRQKYSTSIRGNTNSGGGKLLPANDPKQNFKEQKVDAIGRCLTPDKQQSDSSSINDYLGNNSDYDSSIQLQPSQHSLTSSIQSIRSWRSKLSAARKGMNQSQVQSLPQAQNYIIQEQQLNAYERQFVIMSNEKKQQ